MMTARMLRARRRGLSLTLGFASVWGLAGCSGLGNRLAEKHIPQLGVVDIEQPRELQMVSMPAHVVEPPDELEITVRPAPDDLSGSTYVVQPDGNIDLGFLGDVYVAGLTLEQVEQKVSLQLMAKAGAKAPKTPYQVSARLVNGAQSKSYYVLGTVTTQGKFPITGNDTVLDAILTAGLRTNSIPEKAYLVRPHPAGGPDQILRIDWDGIKNRGDTVTNYQLFPGDRIVVPGGRPPGVLRSLLGG
ncbi:MAG: polysaccharide biosynthesis/export family protein [Gemmataceae bacterium]|nr:polysaccharide biosynthesis/export family protein [Gemmataceae bacterium]